MDKGSVTTQKKGGIGGGPFEWEDLKALVGPSHHDLSFMYLVMLRTLKK